MTTEKEMMDELHAIREQLYEETKHMSPEERVEYKRGQLDEKLKELGITLKRPSPKNWEPVS